MTEQQIRQRYVAELETYLGAKEGDTRHRELMDWYNRLDPLPRGYKMTYTADWCVAITVAVAVKLGLTDIMYPECSCTRAVALYREKGRFVQDRNYIPQTGDFLVYDWEDNRDPDHWGTVVSVSGEKLRIIEGNMNNQVGYRELDMGDSRIYGYCLPEYASKASAFSDAPEGTWFAEAVEYCRRLGLMQGRGAGVFVPDAPVTRAELAAVAMRLHRLMTETE